MEFFGEIPGEVFGEVLFRIVLVILKSIWVSLLWLFNLGQIPYMILWEKTTVAWRGGLVFFAVIIIGIAAYFSFRGSYYFN